MKLARIRFAVYWLVRFNLGQNSNVGTISIRMFCRLIWKHNLLQIWTGSFDVVSDAIFFILTLDTWFNSDKIPMISFNFFHNQDICTYRHFFRWRLEIILHLFTFNNAMLWFGIIATGSDWISSCLLLGFICSKTNDESIWNFLLRISFFMFPVEACKFNN